jgi:hypothetical protein
LAGAGVDGAVFREARGRLERQLSMLQRLDFPNVIDMFLLCSILHV